MNDKALTVQNVIKDIADINGLTDNQRTELFVLVERTIDDYFRANGL